MKSLKWSEDKYNITADYSMFKFEKSVVKYDPFNLTNTYMGRNGVIVLAQEGIDLGGGLSLTTSGPFHSLGHFLEAPDKYCNKPYFGTLKNSPSIWYREGVATAIHVAALRACGYKFSDEQWNAVHATLEWHLRVKFGASRDGATPSYIKPLVQAHITDLLMYWTKARILSEWKRKNKLIRDMPKEPYMKLRWGMLGAVA